MDKFVEELEEILRRNMKGTGLEEQIPSKKETPKGPTTTSGTLTFLGNGDLERMRQRAKEWVEMQRSQMKKDKE